MKSNNKIIHFTDKVLQCANPNCKKLIYSYSQDLAILEATLSGVVRTWTYCSRTCTEKMLSNLNSNNTPFDLQLVIEKQKIISERSPFIIHIDLKIKDLRVEVL